MKNLEKTLNADLGDIPPFRMDNFQHEILDNLHLEFFFQEARFLIAPRLNYLLYGTANPEEETRLQNLLLEKPEQLERIKEFLIYNLSLYSALLETNSYYLALNQHLLIIRFIAVAENPDHFEIKAYTTSKNDLQNNYKDKLYLGRDFFSLQKTRRPHFGFRFIRDSIQEQLQKMKLRLHEFCPEDLFKTVEQDYLQEVEELVGEIYMSGNQILDSLPEDLGAQGVPTDTLIEANMLFRDIKHTLIEIEESLRELENRLFEGEEGRRAVRYVTKFKKDITNNVNYITFKVNGRISDHVNGIRV